MDHIKVLKRAFEITWRYRALWVFGIILTLTAGGGGGNINTVYRIQREWILPRISQEIVWMIVIIGTAIACVVLILIVAGTIAHYVSETALIRMVNDHEEMGKKRTIRHGFRLGWSRTAWRLFLIDLLIGLPLVLLVFLPLMLLLVGGLALSVIVAPEWSTVVGVIGTIVGVGLAFLVILMLTLVTLVVEPLRLFFRRACALEGLGVIKAIRHGFGLVKRHFKDVAIMWLLMIGLGFAWLIVMIPVVILLMLVGVVLGGVPTLAIGGLASLALEELWPWVVGGVVGGLIFIVVVATPLLFLNGLAEVFKSSVWTLAYRELRALEKL